MKSNLVVPRSALGPGGGVGPRLARLRAPEHRHRHSGAVPAGEQQAPEVGRGPLREPTMCGKFQKSNQDSCQVGAGVDPSLWIVGTRGYRQGVGRSVSCESSYRRQAACVFRRYARRNMKLFEEQLQTSILPARSMT